jgi:hypothetical protein
MTVKIFMTRIFIITLVFVFLGPPVFAQTGGQWDQTLKQIDAQKRREQEAEAARKQAEAKSVEEYKRRKQQEDEAARKQAEANARLRQQQAEAAQRRREQQAAEEERKRQEQARQEELARQQQEQERRNNATIIEDSAGNKFLVY